MKYAGHATRFEVFTNPTGADFPDIGIATHRRLTPLELMSPADHADWTSRPGENLQNFQDRIRADLAAQGSSGDWIFVYERGGHFGRNANPRAMAA